MNASGTDHQSRAAETPITDRPVALTVAGSDSSAGAGIQADLKSFSALGVYGLTAVTCVVAETPGEVSRIGAVEPELVRDQIEILLSSFPVKAIKTGLLCSAEIVAVVAQALSKASKVPLVVDPVMIATSGDRLLQEDAIELYRRELFPRASLITPNLDEASVLLGRPITNREQMADGAATLAQQFGTSVLLKGGHLSGGEAVDLLSHEGKTSVFTAPFVEKVKTHGTGCTYSAAITAGLALGFSLEQAIERAKSYVSASIRNHFAWNNIHALNHQPDNRT